MRLKTILRLGPLAAAALSACTLRTIAVRTTGGLLERGALAFQEESDPLFAKDAMPAQLKLAEVLLKNDPKNPDLLKALAEGTVGYAFLFVEDEDPERARAFYRRAAAWGLRLASRSKRFKGLGAMTPKAMAEALAGAGPEDVPGLYWTAYAWAGWANLDKNNPEALAVVPKAERIMRRILELDPDFQFGGADLFFGVYYCARPKIAGGDPARGKKHFEAALKRSGRRFLTAQLLYARYYTVAALDEDLFRALTAEIASTDAGALGQARLANAVAKQKSKKLLEQIDDLF